jgi:hypothetical protein
LKIGLVADDERAKNDCETENESGTSRDLRISHVDKGGHAPYIGVKKAMTLTNKDGYR